MGKRNLAIVGTHQDFFADVYDQDTGLDPSRVIQCASPEDAATSYFDNIFKNSGGLIRSATIAVWPVAQEQKQITIFEAVAELTPCLEPDAGPDEYDVFLDVRERL
jgi:hypothetical protein